MSCDTASSISSSKRWKTYCYIVQICWCPAFQILFINTCDAKVLPCNLHGCILDLFIPQKYSVWNLIAGGCWLLKAWMRSENGFNLRPGRAEGSGWLAKDEWGGKVLMCRIPNSNTQQCAVWCWGEPRDLSAAHSCCGFPYSDALKEKTLFESIFRQEKLVFYELLI